MKKIISLFALLLSVSSCITIEEEVNFNADGSGSMNYVIDFSALAKMMESIEGLELEETADEVEVTDTSEVPEPSFKENMMLTFNSKCGVLRSIPGISAVKLTPDEDSVRYLISFAFNKVSSLNLALNQLIGENDDPSFNYYTFKKKILTRNSGLGEIDQTMNDNGDDGMSEGMLNFFGDSFHYRVNYHFESPVKAKKAKFGELSKDRKRYSMDLNLQDLKGTPEALGVEFKTKIKWN